MSGINNKLVTKESNADGTDREGGVFKLPSTPVPTVEMEAPGVGRVIVNETDIKQYEAQGYKLTLKGRPNQEESTEAYDFKKHTVAELRKIATDNGVPLEDSFKKDDIIAALELAKIDPRVK